MIMSNEPFEVVVIDERDFGHLRKIKGQFIIYIWIRRENTFGSLQLTPLFVPLGYDPSLALGYVSVIDENGQMGFMHPDDWFTTERA